jgi:hypothetical protein
MYLKDEKDKIADYLRTNDMISLRNVDISFTESFESVASKLTSQSTCKREMMTEDLASVKTFYGAFKNLPVSLAADVRFWRGLTHGPMWDYVQKRAVKRYASIRLTQKQLTKDLLKDFQCKITTSGKRILAVNCVSRLWWMGRYTYDETNVLNPYHLTEVLFKNAPASSFVIVAASSLSSRKENILGILSAIKNRSDAGEAVDRNKHIRVATMYLNNLGTTMLLDCLSRNDIEHIVAKRFLDLYGEPSSSLSSCTSTDHEDEDDED